METGKNKEMFIVPELERAEVVEAQGVTVAKIREAQVEVAKLTEALAKVCNEIKI